MGGGSDNYGNVQIPELLGIKPIFLYATPNIIYSTIKNTNYRYEIFHPKSVVYDIMKKNFSYIMPNIKKSKDYKKEGKKEKYSDFEKNVYKVFYDKLNSLEFSKEVKV